ncbi:hypothetical protein C1706_07220 [Propioniciclava flava]|uniref:Uncharacterized protein n=2 Tax=Propioniciclava flava TaxID=2072026 RepID=A0A4Q2EFY9_9ACTN|nr:hypothetical protein [Propioniciclava flava]RXW32467.1 hypothetical protein C1706_07220 [Propioniciclava flava]
MLIDCVGCAARGPACDDCVVSALLGAPEQGAPEQGAPEQGAPEMAALADDERAALGVMAEGGLLPPLRLVARAVPERSQRWRRGA